MNLWMFTDLVVSSYFKFWINSFVIFLIYIKFDSIISWSGWVLSTVRSRNI